MENFILEGRHVRLEPLEQRHVEALTAASAVDPSLYQWSAVPVGRPAVQAYVETAAAARAAGTAVPFATIRRADGDVIGSTRFFDLERWPWPADHPKRQQGLPDACEIGYTWYTKSAIRTAANTEAKLMMLTHAFEVWQMARVCLHTDERNARSRAAMERHGAAGLPLRGHSALPPAGRGPDPPQLGALLHRGRGVAPGEGTHSGHAGEVRWMKEHPSSSYGKTVHVDRVCASRFH
jgi:RimJ/RimL family protein N-acetyltransferase